MFRFATALAFSILPAFALAQECGTRDLIAELGPEDRARLDALVEPHAYATGNLYQATKPGSTVTVVGTLHLPDARHNATVETLTPIIEDADLLIVEASGAAQTEIQNMTATNPDMFFITEGPTLIDLLSEDEWAQLSAKLDEHGLPSFMAAKFQPWFLGMTLAIPPCAMTMMQQGAVGLDFMLEDVAVSNGIPVEDLDDVEALMTMLAGDSMEEQLDGLRMFLSMSRDGNAEMTTMVERYFQGRAREAMEFSRILIEETDMPVDVFDDMMTEILENRNIAWEPKIHDLVEGKDAVVAVGAAHLSGETGVLRALERAGYDISPL